MLLSITLSARFRLVIELFAGARYLQFIFRLCQTEDLLAWVRIMKEKRKGSGQDLIARISMRLKINTSTKRLSLQEIFSRASTPSTNED